MPTKTPKICEKDCKDCFTHNECFQNGNYESDCTVFIPNNWWMMEYRDGKWYKTCYKASPFINEVDPNSPVCSICGKEAIADGW